MKIKLLTATLFVILILTIENNNSQSIENKNQSQLIYYVLIHSPGDNWVDSLSFREQPGVKDHIKYMTTFLENNKLVIGGPFLDNSGGMMICNVETSEEAERIAINDPVVKSGLLKVKVKEWYVAMSNLK